MKTRFRPGGSILARLTTLLLLCSLGASVQAQGNRSESKFSPQQRLGYLGETSRSELARSVLNRLKNKRKVRRVRGSVDRVKMWHEIALDTVALDHTPDPDTGEAAFEQGGPTRTSRALAMTQIAVYDAVNSFGRHFVPYNDIGRNLRFRASTDVAIAYAAHTVLVDLYPSQRDRLDKLLKSDIKQIRDFRSRKNEGRLIGIEAGRAIITRRINDQSQDPEPQFGEGGRVATGTTDFLGKPVNGGGRDIGEWEPDPNTPEFAGDFNLSLGAFWGAVTPFALERGDQFRIPPPPAFGSQEYIAAYNEVAMIGGSPENTGIFSLSTPETRFVGNFWGYDAVPLLGTPPRLYNQIAVQIASDQGVRDPLFMAIVLAMVNVAQADAGIAAWDSKWFYNYWRPVTAIRRDDGVDATMTDPTWDPVGISIVNVELPSGSAFIRPTPPFPAYPSGHSTFAASMFEVLRTLFGDDIGFTFISDEYNGEGVDPFDPSVPRPLVPVRFESLREAQEANGDSRIFNGVHWQYDNTTGQTMGEEISRYLFEEVDAFQINFPWLRRR